VKLAEKKDFHRNYDSQRLEKTATAWLSSSEATGWIFLESADTKNISSEPDFNQLIKTPLDGTTSTAYLAFINGAMIENN
jgi:hypothetical protein